MRVRYRSPDEDSARWGALTLRPGDIVISSRSKHGTTWVQAIVAMLVHGVDLPAPLADLSPWVDHLVEPIDDVIDRLERQEGRRILKSHTPLDGLPDDPALHRVVVVRHPLDAAVSLYHQGANIDRRRVAELTGSGTTDVARPPLVDWLHEWVHRESSPADDLDSLDGVLHHVADAWHRRTDPGVVLVHYADLQRDLGTAVRRFAAAIGLDHDDAVVVSASFDRMRRSADLLAPDRSGVLLDRGAFFRRGRSGDGDAAIRPADRAHYQRRIAGDLAPDLAVWLDR